MDVPVMAPLRRGNLHATTRHGWRVRPPRQIRNLWQPTLPFAFDVLNFPAQLTFYDGQSDGSMCGKRTIELKGSYAPLYRAELVTAVIVP